jgi:hypothetical protein
MQDPTDAIPQVARCEPSNKGKLIGAKPPSPAEARMVDSQQVANRGACTRPGHVQSSYIASSEGVMLSA